MTVIRMHSPSEVSSRLTPYDVSSRVFEGSLKIESVCVE
jgi:hypothetical protein